MVDGAMSPVPSGPSSPFFSRIRSASMATVLLACTGLTVFSSATPAAAQADAEAANTAAARSLFAQGMAAVDGEDFTGAVDLLRRSMALRDSPVVRINLALALVELGRLVEASELLRETIRMEPAGRHAARARAEIERIEPRFAQLRVRIESVDAPREDPDASMTIELDGRQLPDALVGVRQPVDPGEHELQLRVGGEARDARRVTLRPGERRTVDLRAAPGRREETTEPSGGSPVAWGLAIGGGALAVVGGVLLGYALAERAALEDIPRGSVWDEEQARHDAVPLLSGLGITALTVGAAALVGGLFWAVLAADDDRPQAPTTAGVAMGLGVGGLTLRGAW